MTKTEMRRAAGISTNVLAKLGKNEPVAMETLAKIAVAFDCGLDDIVEVVEEQVPVSSDVMQNGISDATARNWEKLNIKSTERLMTRANKRKSVKRVLPLEYIENKESITFVQTILDYIDKNSLDIMSAIFSLGIGLLKKAGIYEKRHVAAVLSEYADN